MGGGLLYPPLTLIDYNSQTLHNNEIKLSDISHGTVRCNPGYIFVTRFFSNPGYCLYDFIALQQIVANFHNF